MEKADPKITPNLGHESNGVHMCRRCGWSFPNAHPSARHRRAHKRICGTIEGYTCVSNSDATTLSHSHSQKSTVSSFSDDERLSDGDSKASNAKGVISRSINEGGSGRVLQRMNTSSDDVFADAVSEFADTCAGSDSEEGLRITTKTTVPHNTVDIQTFPLVEDNSFTGIVQESVNQENSMSEAQLEGSATSLDLEKVVRFSEIPANSETLSDASEENKRTNAFEDPAGLETGFTRIVDASKVNSAMVIMPVSDDACKTSHAVTEGRTSEVLYLAKSEISQSEKQLEVKSGSDTFFDDESQEDKTMLGSSDEIIKAKVEEISPIKVDKIATQLTTAVSAALGSDDMIDFGCETERGISFSLSDDGIKAPLIAAGVETIETAPAPTTLEHESEESNEKYIDGFTGASANGDAVAISTTDINGQGGSDIIDPEVGFEKRDVVANHFTAGAGIKAPENDMESDNPSLDIGTEAHASMMPVVSVTDTDTDENADMEIFDVVGTDNAEGFAPKVLSLNINDKQLVSGVESSHTEGAVQVSSSVKSLDDECIGNSIVFSKEVNLDHAEVSDLVTDPKPISHDVLLQKLEEDLPDDEPVDVECSQATESSSQGLGNNLADDVGVFCKDVGQSKECDADPEKSTTASATDVTYEISSPNGSSSLDGNWGSVSVLSTMSDAAADVKKMKDPQEEQPDDKPEIFDPPSFLTLVESQPQKTAATSSTSSEVHNTQHPDAVKAAWFPSIANVANDSHGRKKNEEIIAKVTSWSAGKQHSPLKTLLGETKDNSPNLNPLAVPKATSPNSPLKNKTAVTTVNSILGSEEPEHPKDKLDSSAKKWSSPARYPDEIKREKRKVKGKPYWVPFMCCSSVK